MNTFRFFFENRHNPWLWYLLLVIEVLIKSVTVMVSSNRLNAKLSNLKVETPKVVTDIWKGFTWCWLSFSRLQKSPIRFYFLQQNQKLILKAVTAEMKQMSLPFLHQVHGPLILLRSDFLRITNLIMIYWKGEAWCG